MKRAIRTKSKGFFENKPAEGECIEEKIRRVTQNGEPITDGAPIIFTEKKDGVLPQYDIRTDRWDIALMAMDAVNKVKTAKSKNYGEKKEEAKKEEPKKGETAGESAEKPN